MEEFLLNELYKFKAILSKDERVKRLNKLDKEISLDKDVISLSNIYKESQDKYNDCLSHFGEKSPLTLKALKNLSESKKNLDSHPLVSEYNKAFIEVSDLYRRINDILLFPIKVNNMCRNCHD